MALERERVSCFFNGSMMYISTIYCFWKGDRIKMHWMRGVIHVVAFFCWVFCHKDGSEKLCLINLNYRLAQAYSDAVLWPVVRISFCLPVCGDFNLFCCHRLGEWSVAFLWWWGRWTSLTTLLGTTDIPLQILFLLIFDRSFVRHELSNTPYSAFQVHLFFSSFTLW